MALNSYSLLRSLLFCLNPETSHDLTLNFLARTQNNFLANLYKEPLISDEVELAGLKFPNRIGLAAGLDKNARCIDAFFHMGFGFVEVGTVTPLAQAGNPKPRLFRIPAKQALINRFGFNNQGVKVFIDNVKQSKLVGKGQLLGLNIGKNANTPIEQATDDYEQCLQQVYPYADYVTINISSPNTKNLRSLQDDNALDNLLSRLQQTKQQLEQQYSRSIPLFVKIAPDLVTGQIATISEILQRNAIAGVIATNTTLARDAVQGLAYANEAGGLSGKPLQQQSNMVIAQLRKYLGKDFPIIGVGGIMSATDAVEKIQAGADMVQIYSGLIYHGTKLVKQIANTLTKI